jgi:uncharacterized protein YaaQ
MVTETPDRLCIIIVQDSDARRLTERLQELGFPATKVASTGGFLRKGNATVLTGVAESDVRTVSNMLHEHFPVSTEFLAAHTLPWWEEGESGDDLIEVRVGGAVMFVVRVARFERI